MGGICDLVGTMPGVLAIALGPDFGSLFGFVWGFKLVRYAPGLALLQRVISDARRALLSVLLAFCLVLLVSASLAYLIERGTQPQVFGSIPAALWWAIVTLTTTGYGDVTPLLRPREYPAGTIIVRSGAPGDCMYFVVSGEVEVQVRPEPVILGPGEFFGEVALLTGGPRNATIVAARHCTLLILDI